MKSEIGCSLKLAVAKEDRIVYLFDDQGKRLQVSVSVF